MPGRMTTLCVMACVLLGATACGAPESPPELGDLYAAGVTFEEYLPEAADRNELWRENWERSEVPVDLRDRVPTSPDSPWRLLAVAHPGCSDSMSSIPHLARLADEIEGLELRIISSERGESIMEAHRTPDDRSATPTVVLLNDAMELAGCWVEQPAALQEWWLGEARDLPGEERFEQKMDWYARDAGRETMADLLGIIEAASEGRMVCPGG